MEARRGKRLLENSWGNEGRQSSGESGGQDRSNDQCRESLAESNRYQGKTPLSAEEQSGARRILVGEILLSRKAEKLIASWWRESKVQESIKAPESRRSEKLFVVGFALLPELVIAKQEGTEL